MRFCRTKFLAAIWFFALIFNVFPVANFAANSDNQAQIVYCPLTKKLQPVKAAKKEVRQNPLGKICAVEAANFFLVDELFVKNLLKTSLLDENQFENLVFDFFQKGKAAFANLPQFPDLPHKSSVNIFSSAAVFSKNNETQIIWKLQVEKYNFAQNPRPPDDISANLFESSNSPKLNKISRRIPPRAPPFSL